MTYIAIRLREHAEFLREAADEIERLEERVAELQAQWGYTESIQTVEIERLRAALDDECTAHQVCVEMRDNANAEIERLHGEIEQYRERLGLP